MKNHLQQNYFPSLILSMMIAVSITLSMPSYAATVNLATVPLATATTTNVLPNLMFTLDDSGSMDSNYLPDWASDSICKGTSGSYSSACLNQPPYRSSDFNAIYYNPAIYYKPAVNADGTSKGSQTSWSSVKNDAYNIQDTGSTNLVTGYTDVEWCTSSAYTDCLRNNNYILPGTVNGKSYTTLRPSVKATGSGLVATGSPLSPTTATRSWGPHYYTIIPGEYCDSLKLRNCQATATATFKYPAKVRWCNTSANAKAATPAVGSCQATRLGGSFDNVRFPTMTSAATATFTIALSGCTNSKQVAVQSVTVNGVNLLTSATSLEKSSSNLASAIASNIGNGGYSASSSSSTVTITAPASAGNINYSVTLARTSGSNAACTYTINPSLPTFSGYNAGVSGSFVRTDIVPTTTSYPKTAARTDCAGATCTYDDEMTNFANWWSYYQTRMQAMKTAASLAFQPIDSRYRVGFNAISYSGATDGTKFLHIDTFNAAQKNIMVC